MDDSEAEDSKPEVKIKSEELVRQHNEPDDSLHRSRNTLCKSNFITCIYSFRYFFPVFKVQNMYVSMTMCSLVFSYFFLKSAPKPLEFENLDSFLQRCHKKKEKERQDRLQPRITNFFSRAVLQLCYLNGKKFPEISHFL